MTRRSGDRARDLTIAVLKGDSKLVAGGAQGSRAHVRARVMHAGTGGADVPWKARGAHGEVAKHAPKALELRQGGGARVRR